MISALLGLILLMPQSPVQVANPTVCLSEVGSFEKTVTAGTVVRLCFSTDYDADFRYFRLRRSQTQEGSYDFFQRINMADCIVDQGLIHGSITFTAQRTEHYFATSIGEVSPGVLHETPGSQHAKLTVTP